MTLRELLASARLMRLAHQVVQEMRAAQQEADEDARWQREAQQRLAGYMS